MIKHAVVLLVAGALAVFTVAAVAEDHAAAKPAPKTITGELVDTGCYLGHGARGAKHTECATKCIAKGMPMGLLTDDGTLYLLTMNHANEDPYNKLKKMAAKNVAVTGPVFERNGMKAIEVTAYKPAAAASQ